MGKGKHKRDKSLQQIKGFDNHRKAQTSRAVEKYNADGIGRRAMGCFYSRRYYVNPEEPHFRMTARTMALPGGHMRDVARPPKAAHSKTM